MSMMQTGSLELNSDQPTVTTSGDTSTFTSVDFATPFPEGSQVIVIPMTQTFNGYQSPGIRIAEVTNTGFKIRFNELVGTQPNLSNGTHNTETVGWVAYTV